MPGDLQGQAAAAYNGPPMKLYTAEAWAIKEMAEVGEVVVTEIPEITT